VRPRLRTTVAQAGKRLDVTLAEWLPGVLGRPLSKSALRRLIMAGAVLVDGRPLRAPGRVLRAGAEVVARVEVERLVPERAPEDRVFVLSRKAILYEDDALIAVDKPPGLATVPTADPARPSLVRAVEEFLARAGRGAPSLGVHQRLDADTSGVVLFAKDARANPALAATFAEGEAEKTYMALTRRPSKLPPRAWSVDSALAPRGRAGMASARSGGQRAHTDFVLLEVFAAALLVEARPRTGRKHQIRVHLAESGLPVLGDPLYGSSSGSHESVRRGPHVPRLMLHARRLALRHPIDGTSLEIETPLPEDWSGVLEALRSSPGRLARFSDRGRTRPR
jgi:RluA family pseudouridine synthase